jgi:acyl-CoA thioesterase-2
MHPSTAMLLERLGLQEISKDVYQASGQLDSGDHLFGGIVLAQGLAAAAETVSGKNPHSIHAQFLHRGDPKQLIDYEIRRLRDSRAFATRESTAMQDGVAIATVTASFHHDEEGPEHQLPMSPGDGPGGESWEGSLREALGMPKSATPDSSVMGELPIEILAPDGFAMFSRNVKQPHVTAWMRTRSALPSDPLIHQCALAYASDYIIQAGSFHAHPISAMEVQSASLDHALWFHRPIQFDQWHRVDLDSPITAGGRGIGRALIFSQSGELVASSVQEHLIRPTADGKHPAARKRQAPNPT